MKMKKTRLLSLALVLAMVLALVPTVFAENCADGSHTWGAWESVTEGEAIVHKRACTVEGCTATETHAPEFNSSSTYQKDAEKHWKVCAHEGCSLEDTDHKEVHTWDAAGVKCTVSACGYTKIDSVAVTLTPATVTAASEMPTATATATVSGKDGVTLDDDQKKVTWESKTPAVATIAADGKITAVKPGKTNIVATALDGVTKSAETVFTVKPAAATVTAPTNNTFATQKVSKGTAPAQYSVTVTAPGEGLSLDYKWKVDNKEQTNTSVDKSKFTPVTTDLTAGDHTVTCIITVKTTDGVESDAVNVTGTLTIVAPYQVEVKKYSGTATVGQRVYYSATLKKYDAVKKDYVIVNDSDFSKVIFSSSTPSVAKIYSGSDMSSKTGSLAFDLYSAGTSNLSAKVYLSSVDRSGQDVDIVGERSVTVTEAKVTDQTMAPTTSSYALIDTYTLYNAIYSTVNGGSAATTITPYEITFYGNGYGTFSSNGSTGASSYSYRVNSSSNVYFVPSSAFTGFTSPNMYVTYTAKSADGTIASGKIYFTSASSISYSTTTSVPVYFKSSDFEDYFKTALSNSISSRLYSLSYVTFGTPRVSTGSATVGMLYYNNSAVYSNTQVTAANLGYVYYTPSASATTYTVSIPFTAYGTYSYGTVATQTVSGTVTIKVNDGHVIGMTGTDFKTAGIWSDILSKHPNTSYVVFSQPQSTVGKLYYGYSSIANKGNLVSYTDKFNNTSYANSYASTYKSIEGIYFVPAADCLTTVSIPYTAYTSSGSVIGTSDTITFTVSKKTSSYWFNDVTASNTGKWSADAIDFLAANSIVEGGSYGTFNPNGNMTRGDFVLMLYRLAGKPSVSGISNPFTDVKATDYYYNAILWAYRNDIVTGIDRKTFAPKKNITREQIAATLYRMAGSPSTSGSISGYYDASKVHSYATNAMRWAVAGGVVTGSNGYLTPTNNATRAQVATMLHRYLTK